MTLRAQRIIKVWLYVVAGTSGFLSPFLLTNDLRSLIVLTIVSIALGCLGTLIAVLTQERT